MCRPDDRQDAGTFPGRPGTAFQNAIHDRLFALEFVPAVVVHQSVEDRVGEHCKRVWFRAMEPGRWDASFCTGRSHLIHHHLEGWRPIALHDAGKCVLIVRTGRRRVRSGLLHVVVNPEHRESPTKFAGTHEFFRHSCSFPFPWDPAMTCTRHPGVPLAHSTVPSTRTYPLLLRPGTLERWHWGTNILPFKAVSIPGPLPIAPSRRTVRAPQEKSPDRT